MRQVADGDHRGQPKGDETEDDEAGEWGRGEEGGGGRAFHPGVEGVTVSLDVNEVHDGEDKRGDSDEGRPEGDKEVLERGVDDRWVASDVFEDVEAVVLNDDG